MLRRVAIRGIHLSAWLYCREMVWWLLYAGHRAVFKVRRNIVCRRITFGVSGYVGCSHMSVDLKIGSFLIEQWSYAFVIAYE